MAITDSQKAVIADWLNQGVSLSDIQTQIKTEFGISLTFMETRFLIDDLDLEIKKEEVPEKEEEPSEKAQPEEVATTGVSLEIDTIVTPGAMVSGSVIFTDGIEAKWQIDQMGRLGLTGVADGYQPTPEDVQEFQTTLQLELQKKGMA